MNPGKIAKTDYPVLEVITHRWSPYAFQPRTVERAKLMACLDAARWAASSFNEQPWVFLAAFREDTAEFEKMLGCLMEMNQVWARQAGVLLLTAVSITFSRNGNPNRVAEHDLGLAMGNFCCQATQLGLAVHQMAGIHLEQIRTTYQIPSGYDPLTGIALGYAAEPEAAPNSQLADRDRAVRTRKPFHEFVYHGQWGTPLK